jgi:DUF4097 and DUF4098 domain-containing protein YvlB
MKKLIVIGLLFLAAPTQAREEHKTRDVSAKPEIIIYNTSGEVEVEGWSKNQVDIEADLGGGVKELVFEVSGNEVLIEVIGPEHGGRNIASDLIIRVPIGSSLEIGTVSADITIENVTGRQRIDTVSGDIDTVAFDSNLDLESVSGDIVAKGNDKKISVRADTVSGDLEFEGLDGDVELDTVSGDVVLVHSRFENVRADTVNGDIDFFAGLYGDSRMEFETVNGSIDIKFDGDVSARFDIETFNGSIRNCFGPEAVRTSKYAPGRELKFTEGDGKGRVVIRTLNGSLTICKE